MSSSPFTRLTRWLLTLTVLVTPFVFTWVNEELFEFPKMLVVYGLVALTLGSALIDQLHQKTQKWPSFRQLKTLDWAILAFVLSQVLATLFSIQPRTSWLGYYTRFNGGLLSTLTYTTFYFLLTRYFSLPQLTRLTRAAVITGLIAALYAFPEHFGHSPSCLLILKSWGVDCWVQDVKSRVFGTFGQPNWLAAEIITLLPLTLAWLSQAKTLWRKLGWGLAWGVLLSVLIFTKSRSGLVGLMGGLSLGLGLVGWRLWWLKRQNSAPKLTLGLKSIWPVGLILSGSLAWLAWTGTPLSPSLADSWFNSQLQSPIAQVDSRPAGTSLETGGTESGEIRKIVWSGAVAIWKRYPLFGSGVETFAYSYYQDRPATHNQVSEWDFLYNKAHNEFLNYLATTGAVGLLSYLSLWVVIGIGILGQLKHSNSSHQTGIAIAWLTGLVAQGISNFFGFSTVAINVLFWLGLAWLGVWTHQTSLASAAPVQNSSAPTLTGWNWVKAAGITILSLWTITLVLTWWSADRDYAASKALLAAGSYELGMTKLEQAIAASPSEALFWDELANQYSRLAVALKTSPQASTSGEVITQLSQAAVAASDQTLALNSRHLDFHKTRARIFINLSQIDPTYLTQAQAALQTAIKLSPTDPKLVYHLGLVEISAGQTSAGLAHLEQAVAMKPNYLTAWFDLGKAYEQAGQPTNAIATYERLLELSPQNPEVTAQLKALQNLDQTP